MEPFNIRTLDELCDEACHLNLDLPVSSHINLLGESLTIANRTTPNRLCVQPMEGCDADAGGAPGKLTFRRYRRYAEGGFGLIWLEAVAVDGAGGFDGVDKISVSVHRPHLRRDEGGEGLKLLEEDIKRPLELMRQKSEIDSYELLVTSTDEMRTLGETQVTLSVNSMKAFEIILTKVYLN